MLPLAHVYVGDLVLRSGPGEPRVYHNTHPKYFATWLAWTMLDNRLSSHAIGNLELPDAREFHDKHYDGGRGHWLAACVKEFVRNNTASAGDALLAFCQYHLENSKEGEIPSLATIAEEFRLAAAPSRSAKYIDGTEVGLAVRRLRIRMMVASVCSCTPTDMSALGPAAPVVQEGFAFYALPLILCLAFLRPDWVPNTVVSTSTATEYAVDDLYSLLTTGTLTKPQDILQVLIRMKQAGKTSDCKTFVLETLVPRFAALATKINAFLENNVDQVIRYVEPDPHFNAYEKLSPDQLQHWSAQASRLQARMTSSECTNFKIGESLQQTLTKFENLTVSAVSAEADLLNTVYSYFEHVKVRTCSDNTLPPRRRCPRAAFLWL